MKRNNKKQFETIELETILKNNPLVDRELVAKSQSDLKELNKLGFVKKGYDLPIPYSQCVRSALD